MTQSDQQQEKPGGGHPPHTLTVIIDDHSVEVHPGQWVVSDLKTAGGVDSAKVLAEITPKGLKDLEDHAIIEVHEREKFMSHVRSGGSS